MKVRALLMTVVFGALMLINGLALAADQARSQDNDQAQDQVYGSQLMTNQERAEHRMRMREASSMEERMQIRKQHHERMKQRASKQGITLPDEPPVPGGGMGPGGGGMGPGAGRNR